MVFPLCTVHLVRHTDGTSTHHTIVSLKISIDYDGKPWRVAEYPLVLSCRTSAAKLHNIEFTLNSISTDSRWSYYIISSNISRHFLQWLASAATIHCQMQNCSCRNHLLHYQLCWIYCSFCAFCIWWYTKTRIFPHFRKWFAISWGFDSSHIGSHLRPLLSSMRIMMSAPTASRQLS